MPLPSGVFHDAALPAEVRCPAITFAPCGNEISDSPGEDATPEDLAAGARVLAASLVELAGIG